jgi:hypothetical protein
MARTPPCPPIRNCVSEAIRECCQQPTRTPGKQGNRMSVSSSGSKASHLESDRPAANERGREASSSYHSDSPIIAGRALRATRALPRRPRPETSPQANEDALPDMKFPSGTGPPSCTPTLNPATGPPIKTTPNTNDIKKGKPGCLRARSANPQSQPAAEETPQSAS